MALVLNALGVFGDGGGLEEHGVQSFFIICGVIAVAASLVFGWLVPRGLRREAAGGTAVTMSILAALLVFPAFWSGLPPILGAGGMLLGWAGRSATKGAALCHAAVVVGALALVSDVVIYVLDWMSTNAIL
jgi:hypothetical protein